MMTPIVYAGIFILSMYIAMVAHGYIMAFAFIVGGIAFFALQRYFYGYYSEIAGEGEVDSAPEDDTNQLRLPPA